MCKHTMERNYVETHTGAEICANTQCSGNMCKYAVERKYVQTHSGAEICANTQFPQSFGRFTHSELCFSTYFSLQEVWRNHGIFCSAMTWGLPWNLLLKKFFAKKKNHILEVINVLKFHDLWEQMPWFFSNVRTFQDYYRVFSF